MVQDPPVIRIAHVALTSRARSAAAGFPVVARLRADPMVEGRHLGPLEVTGRRHEVISQLARQADVERRYQPPGIQIVRRQHPARQRHPLPRHGRLKHQGRIGEPRSPRRIHPLGADRLKPHGPAVQEIVVEQGEPAQVLRLQQGLGAIQQAGRADGEDILGQQPVGPHALPAAAPEADRRIDVLLGEIHHLRRRGDQHVDFRMPLLKAGQARHQPLGGEGCHRADGQSAAAVGGLQPGGGVGDLVQRVAQRRQI